MSEGSPAPPTEQPGWIPGEPGLWVLVFGDMFVFALFFATFAYYRLEEPAIFRESQHALHQGFGLLNTMLLLTSSWFVANAVRASRIDRKRDAARWTLAAMLLGGGFVVVKAFEYREKFQANLMPSTNDFFMLYFVFTGIHLVHVAIGLIALAFARSQMAKPPSTSRANVIEGCAVFWHMVDVLWVILFAILYLHR